MPTLHVVVLRPFAIAGVRQEVGARLEVDMALAAELRGAGKAATAPQPAPETPTDTAPAPRASRAKKEPSS